MVAPIYWKGCWFLLVNVDFRSREVPWKELSSFSCEFVFILFKRRERFA